MQTSAQKVVGWLSLPGVTLRRFHGGHWSTETPPPDGGADWVPKQFVGSVTVRRMLDGGRIAAVSATDRFEEQQFVLCPLATNLPLAHTLIRTRSQVT